MRPNNRVRQIIRQRRAIVNRQADERILNDALAVQAKMKTSEKPAALAKEMVKGRALLRSAFVFALKNGGGL
jgi:hypothetical protein